MNVLSAIRNKKAGGYLHLALLVLGIVSLICYLIYATSSDNLMMPWVIVFLALAIVCEVILFFKDNDYIPILEAIFFPLSFGCFLVSPSATIFTVVYHFQNIAMDGSNDELFGIIIAVAAILVFSSVIAVVGCFLDREKKGEAVVR